MLIRQDVHGAMMSLLPTTAIILALIFNNVVGTNMKAAFLPKVRIESCGTYLPETIVTSKDLFAEFDSETNYGISQDWMAEKMGITERRVSPPGSLPSELAIPAAHEAIENSPDTSYEQIDMVVFCGIEGDQSEPATAHTICHALGINAKYAFDTSNACYGFVNGMEIACSFIETRRARAALVVTGEIPCRVLEAAVKRLKSGLGLRQARQIIGALSVGDAGGAVILSASNDTVSGFDLINTHSYSSHTEKCIYKKKENGEIDGQMQMGRITKAIVDCHEKLIDDTLGRLGWHDFDWMMTHQMGQKPFDRLSRLKGVNPRSMIKTFPKLGNITSATLPISFHKLVNSGMVKTGHRIGGCFTGSGLAIGQFGYTY